VPIDIELAEDQRMLVISGGNAGGKTVALKTLGISALMAASNIPVPAREGSTLPVWRDIRVLLGDQQSIEDSLSTFTAQIDSLAKAWNSIDDGVLVIMDEFGAGTDPTQGAALAQAVLDGLLEKNAWAAVATHFPALKAYALAGKGVRSASVLFDPETRKPLFELAYDLAGESQALVVARERGLPHEILERAEKYLLLEGPETGGVMDRLNELAISRTRELERLQSERAKLEEKRLKLEKSFKAEKDALLKDMKAKAQGIVHQWQQDKISRKRALKELSDVRETLAAFGQKTEAPAVKEVSTVLDMESATPGTLAKYPAFGKTGVIRENDPKRGMVKLDMDGVAMWLKPEDLERQEVPGEKRQAPAGVTASRSVGLSLDLRGFRADEARAELQKFLDRAILSGHQHLEVVHGKGTGALRREVQDVLRNSPVVSNYELAPEEMGGDGMTKVELK
jgi:DNA mismatch repair protein MutS2